MFSVLRFTGIHSRPITTCQQTIFTCIHAFIVRFFFPYFKVSMDSKKNYGVVRFTDIHSNPIALYQPAFGMYSYALTCEFLTYLKVYISSQNV